MDRDAATLPAPPITNPSKRFDALLALRGFACLMVVAAHCAPPRNAINYLGLDLSWLIFSAGGVAVRIFFCLSGYLMGKLFYTERYTADRSGILNYWGNRAWRILPLYYFAVIVLSLFVYRDIRNWENLPYLLRLLTFTYNQTLPVAFNGALWSLSTEVQFYPVVPLVFKILKNQLIYPHKVIQFIVNILLGFSLLRSAIWLALAEPGQAPINSVNFVQFIYNPLLTNLDSFLCGFSINALILGNFRQSSFYKKFHFLSFLLKIPKSIAAGFLIIGLYFSAAYLKYYHQNLLLFIGPPLAAVVTSAFIFLVEEEDYFKAHQRPEKISLTSCLQNPLKILENFGNLSYGLYIWHLPILENIARMVTSPTPLDAYFRRFLATLILSLAVASLTYYFVEIPAFRLKKIYKKI